jgi:hypothetical protein
LGGAFYAYAGSFFLAGKSLVSLLKTIVCVRKQPICVMRFMHAASLSRPAVKVPEKLAENHHGGEVKSGVVGKQGLMEQMTKDEAPMTKESAEVMLDCWLSN